MFCTNCGLKVEREDSRFCPNCGAPLCDGACADAAAPLAQPVSPDATAPLPRAGAADPVAAPPCAEAPRPAPRGDEPAGGGRGRRHRRGPLVALVVVLCLLAFAGAGAGVWWKYETDRRAAEEAARQAAWDAEHAERPVHLSVVAPNYDSGATRIPLRVTGTDLDGQAVEETYYVNADTPEIGLRKGDYQVTVVASPILQDGGLYAVPSEPVALEVGDAPAGSDQDAQSVQTVEVELTAIDDPTTITDEQIAAARAAAEADPDAGQAAKAGPYAEAATKRRDDAVAAKRAAEEEAARQRAAEEEARKKAEEERKAASSRQRRAEIAVAFAEKFNSNAYTDGSEGSPGLYFQDFSAWQSEVMGYLEPSSRVYRDVAAQTGFSGNPVQVENARLARASADGGDCTVAMDTSVGQGAPQADKHKGGALKWSAVTSSTLSMTVSFNDEDLVTMVRMGDPV